LIQVEAAWPLLQREKERAPAAHNDDAGIHKHRLNGRRRHKYLLGDKWRWDRLVQPDAD
jgi:hypothetical protein